MSLSIAGAIPEDRDRKEIAEAGDVALTQLREVWEGKDILVPSKAGTKLGMDKVCSTEWRLTVQHRRERAVCRVKRQNVLEIGSSTPV
jgi:hypothetical protein